MLTDPPPDISAIIASSCIEDFILLFGYFFFGALLGLNAGEYTTLFELLLELVDLVELAEAKALFFVETTSVTVIVN